MNDSQFHPGRDPGPQFASERGGCGRGSGHRHSHSGRRGGRAGTETAAGRIGRVVAEFVWGVEGGEGSMFDNGRDWRGHGRHGRDRHEFGFGRGRGRTERPFEQGDLRWLVLDLIAAQPKHGYEIIKEIEDTLKGEYSPSPGVVYPTLTFLEETGLIAGEAQGSKKLYSITEEGRAALEANAAAVQAVRSRIDAFRMRLGGPPAPEIIRAMTNLRAAIQVRWSKGDLSPESLAAITAAIDRAAGEIERS